MLRHEHNRAGWCQSQHKPVLRVVAVSGIDIAPVECLWAFDGDGQAFNLAVEAKRIEIAFLFDPMLAVHVGTVDRHQITAVYESMLPRLPLRYVLADDSGAVKTIAPKPPAD